MDVLDQVFRPYLEGQPAVLLTNRSLFDLVVDGEGKMRPLGELVLRRQKLSGNSQGWENVH